MALPALAAAGLHQVASTLFRPQQHGTGFSVDDKNRPAGTPPNDAGGGALPAWLTAQLQVGTGATDPARIRNAYAGASALAGNG